MEKETPQEPLNSDPTVDTLAAENVDPSGEKLPLQDEINELLDIAKQGEEAQLKFEELLKKLEQPLVVIRYTPLKPVFMDDIHDAVNAALGLLDQRGIIDIKDHGTREIHDTLASILSEYFGDPNYKSHTTTTTEKSDDVNEREGI